MQMLFKTLNVPVQQNIQTPITQQTTTQNTQSFTQQFATTNGVNSITKYNVHRIHMEDQT